MPTLSGMLDVVIYPLAWTVHEVVRSRQAKFMVHSAALGESPWGSTRVTRCGCRPNPGLPNASTGVDNETSSAKWAMVWRDMICCP